MLYLKVLMLGHPFVHVSEFADKVGHETGYVHQPNSLWVTLQKSNLKYENPVNFHADEEANDVEMRIEKK